MDSAQNTQNSDLRTTMFMVTAPTIITGGNFALSTCSPAPNNPQQYLVNLFERHVSLSATHDTIEDHHPPRCDPEAHQAYLDRFIAWAEDPESAPILWVSGPKGCGKTSVAGTLAQILQQRDRLGATFFLNEDDKRASDVFLIPTIALQLSERVPALQPLMVDVIQRAPFLFRKSLSTQMEQLIIKPIMSLYPYDYLQQVIIIDGLDDCHAPGSASRILGVIHENAPRLLGRAKFLLLGRPEVATRLSQPSSVVYMPPVDSVHRKFMRQSTSVNQPSTVNPMQAFYMPILSPQEEPCAECVMRDRDMVDVDVVSPGAWERESDAEFEEHKARELEEEANGIVVDNPTKPRIKGGRLTERNVELWLSHSSREGNLRNHFLNAYIKSQRALLEAEGVVRARAVRETRERESHSQIRRSARDLENSCDSSPGDSMGEPSPLLNAPHDLGNEISDEPDEARHEGYDARDRDQVDEIRERRSAQESTVNVMPIGPLDDDGLRLCSEHSSHAQATTNRLDRPSTYSRTTSSSDIHDMKSSCSRRERFVVGCRDAWWVCSTRVLTASILLRGPLLVSKYLTGGFFLRPPRNLFILSRFFDAWTNLCVTQWP